MKDRVAILQIIPNHHGLLPKRLVKAVALLDRLAIPCRVYDIERSPVRDYKQALVGLLGSIRERTVLVSMACHNNYPKIDSLLFLFMYLPLLKGKRVVVCSPYFSLYAIDRIQSHGVDFVLEEIDDHVKNAYGDPGLSDAVFFKQLPGLLERLGYAGYRFWEYLTFGCRGSCSFCYNKLPWKGAPALGYGCPETVLAWMRAARDTGQTYFEFSEPNFLADRAFALGFLYRLKKEAPGVTWRCKTRLDDIDEGLYRLMTSAGCRTIFFGVEHVRASMLRQVRKKASTSKGLASFLKYRKTETMVHLSFLTGIKGEGVEDLRDNLRAVLKVGGIPDVEPNIGWQLVYDPRKRRVDRHNYIVPFMSMLNFIPGRFDVSPLFMRGLFTFSLKNPFFGYLYQTESERSLELMQALVCFLKENPGQKIIRDYDLLLRYGAGALTKAILKSRSVDELNKQVLAFLGL